MKLLYENVCSIGQVCRSWEVPIAQPFVVSFASAVCAFSSLVIGHPRGRIWPSPSQHLRSLSRKPTIRENQKDRYVKFICALLVLFLKFLNFILVAFMIRHLLVQLLLKIILTSAAIYNNSIPKLQR